MAQALEKLNAIRSKVFKLVPVLQTNINQNLTTTPQITTTTTIRTTKNPSASSKRNQTEPLLSPTNELRQGSRILLQPSTAPFMKTYWPPDISVKKLSDMDPELKNLQLVDVHLEKSRLREEALARRGKPVRVSGMQ